MSDSIVHALLGAESTPPDETSPRIDNEKQTAKQAVRLLIASGAGFRLPTKTERSALLVGFAMRGLVLYGAAFDVVRLTQDVDLADPHDISTKIDAITVYEIKSTKNGRTKADFSGYFFDLTTAELLVAQSLGTRFKFAFVNIITCKWIELTLPEVFAKSRKIYPKWAVSF